MRIWRICHLIKNQKLTLTVLMWRPQGFSYLNQQPPSSSFIIVSYIVKKKGKVIFQLYKSVAKIFWEAERWLLLVTEWYKIVWNTNICMDDVLGLQ